MGVAQVVSFTRCSVCISWVAILNTFLLKGHLQVLQWEENLKNAM